MVVFDTTALLHLLDPQLPGPIDPSTHQLVTNTNLRITHLVANLQKHREKIIIPTPALSELLILAESAGAAYIARLTKSSMFQSGPFDERAAIELAVMTAATIRAGDKRAGSTATMAKIKFDRQIVAIACVHRVSTIYSDDKEVRKFAEANNIKTVAVWELPLPPEAAQIVLPLDEPSSDENKSS
jgi:predicted nucleic acid-binding protein